jgi:hypothetical protein
MKKVPLVMYEGGERRVIGEAVLYDDGKVEGQIKDEVNLPEALKSSLVFGASLGPLPLIERDI